MKEKLRDFLHMLSFRSMWEEQEEDDWEDFDTRDDYISGAGEQGEGSARGVRPGVIWAIVVSLIILAAAVYQEASHHHTYTSYQVTDSYEGSDASGLSYVKLGNGFVKFGSDGVSAVDAADAVLWSSAYTMKTPVDDVCGNTLLIYEQQGNQAAVLSPSGVTGQYQTDLPILRGAVAENGVAAFILKDDGGALVRLYSTDGTVLAEIRMTLEETGYPCALDLTTDGVGLMVSAVKPGSGSVDSSVLFYDFSSATETAADHIRGSISYTDTVIPEVFYATDSIPVAVSDSSIMIYSGSSSPSEKEVIDIGDSVLSLFHDEDTVGVIRQSDDSLNRYEIASYNYRGKQTMSSLFNEGYTSVAVDQGEILLSSPGHLMAFTPDGTLRLDTDYDKTIAAFMKIPGFRRYCIFTGSSMDRIRAE